MSDSLDSLLEAIEQMEGVSELGSDATLEQSIPLWILLQWKERLMHLLHLGAGMAGEDSDIQPGSIIDEAELEHDVAWWIRTVVNLLIDIRATVSNATQDYG